MLVVEQNVMKTYVQYGTWAPQLLAIALITINVKKYAVFIKLTIQ